MNAQLMSPVESRRWLDDQRRYLDRLRARKDAIPGEVEAVRVRYESLRDEFSAVKRQIEAVELVLTTHEVHFGDPARALMPPKEPKRSAEGQPGRTPNHTAPRADRKVYDRSSPDYVPNIVERWFDEHEGVLVLNEIATHLAAVGRFSYKDRARNAVFHALKPMLHRGEVENHARGVYRRV